MARLPNNETLYETFRSFLDSCLIQSHSLLWPGQEYWTLTNLSAVKKKLVDSPVLGRELSFEEKLEIQMEGASPDEWAIICDIYYIYFLPSAQMTHKKISGDIRWAAEKGNIIPPADDAGIWKVQKHGFTRTGVRYHYKYLQFWLIILFAQYVKEHEDPHSVVSKPHVMQEALDMILGNIENRVDRAHDIRHAMLHMAFPDSYERMISTRDKKRVIERYRREIDEPMPPDIDEAIRLVRGALSERHDKPDRAFDFYTELKDEWRPKTAVLPDTEKIDTEMGLVTVPPDDDSSDEPTETAEGVTEHTKIQWLLLKLGSDMGLDIWVAKNDRNREVAGQKFSDLPRLKRELPLTFDEVTNKTIGLIDVLWLKENAILAAFEIESTTSIYSGLLRMADLIAMQPNLNIPLYLVAPDERRNKVMAEINRPVFRRLSPSMFEVCRYISFSSLKDKIMESAPFVKHMKPDFLDDFAEVCELEEY